jgi:hypothetical protein
VLAAARTEKHPITFEGGHPRAYLYEELLIAVVHGANVKPTLIPIPFGTWQAVCTENSDFNAFAAD